VLFVSHNMPSVTALCPRAIVLDAGSITFDGPSSEASYHYMESLHAGAHTDHESLALRKGTGELRITKMEPTKQVFASEEAKEFEFTIERFAELEGDYSLVVEVEDDTGVLISRLDSLWLGKLLRGDRSTGGKLTIRTPWLRPGNYTINAFLNGVGIHSTFDWAMRLTRFTVAPNMPFPNMAEPDPYNPSPILTDFDMIADSVVFLASLHVVVD